MTYTINGKDYTEFDINKRCAELLGLIVETEFQANVGFTESFHEKYPNTIWAAEVDRFGNQLTVWEQKIYTRDPTDTWPIIEKCWDELMMFNNVVIGDGTYSSETEWNEIMEKYNCTKLVAPCICFIEINEDKL